MNLIEQLGGYEKAIKMSKEWESSIDGDIPLDTMMYSYDFGIFSWGDLQSALLDYRRQHNIYEVGDNVVSTLDGDDFWMHFVCTIDGFHKKMIITNGGGHIIHHYEFRHATDEEIKAGHRL